MSPKIKPPTKEDNQSLRELERSLNAILKRFNIKHLVFKNSDSLNIEKNISFLMIELVKIFGSKLVSLKLPGIGEENSQNSFRDFFDESKFLNFGSLSNILG